MKKFAFSVVVAALLCVAAASLGYMAWLLGQNGTAAVQNRLLAAQVAAQTPAGTAQPAPAAVDWPALQAQNPDLCGWLRWPAVGVDLPIAHTADNAFYLTHSWDKSANRLGCLFVGADCAADFSGPCTLVYGHNMTDGQMFGRLARYREEAFWRENPEFWLYTPAAVYRGRVFACCPAVDGGPLYRTAFADEDDRQAWLRALGAAALYQTDIAPGAGERVVVFSTCDNRTRDGRLLVCAVLDDAE